MATNNISTWTEGMEDLRTNLMNGAGDTEGLARSFIKAIQGDIKFVCTPSTVTKTPTSDAWTQTVVVTMTNNDGELCQWYNGNVTLAVGDTGTGTASITPTAGVVTMTDGSLTVVLAGDAGSTYWKNSETATLTVSPTANNSGIAMGSLIANATCVVTFTT
jgi:hypothetical protein